MRKSEACNNCSREVTNRIELSAAIKAHSYVTRRTHHAKNRSLYIHVLCIWRRLTWRSREYTLPHDCSHLIGLPRFWVVIRKPGKSYQTSLFPPPQYFTRMRATHAEKYGWLARLGVSIMLMYTSMYKPDELDQAG